LIRSARTGKPMRLIHAPGESPLRKGPAGLARAVQGLLFG
jgi:hypothetical protein